jgi:hypothetical protein
MDLSRGLGDVYKRQVFHFVAAMLIQIRLFLRFT